MGGGDKCKSCLLAMHCKRSNYHLSVSLRLLQIVFSPSSSSRPELTQGVRESGHVVLHQLDPYYVTVFQIVLILIFSP